MEDLSLSRKSDETASCQDSPTPTGEFKSQFCATSGLLEQGAQNKVKDQYDLQRHVFSRYFSSYVTEKQALNSSLMYLC